MNSRITSGNHDSAFFRRAAVALFLVAAMSAGLTTAEAANSVDAVCGVMADELNQYATHQKKVDAKIYVDTISLPPKYNSPGGESIRIALKSALKAKHFQLVNKSRQADWIIQGKCMSRAGSNDLTMVVEVIDQNGVSLDVMQNLVKKFDQKGYQPTRKTMGELQLDRQPKTAPKAVATLNDMVEITRMKGFTGDLSTYVSNKVKIKLEGTNYSSGRGQPMLRDYRTLSRTEQMMVSRETRSVLNKLTGTHIDELDCELRPESGGTAVSASKNSLFELHLVVKDSPYAKPRWLHIGPDKIDPHLLFTQLQPQQQYSIGIKNRSNHDVGVVVTVDGVNTLHFCEDASMKAEGKWFVRKEETIYVQGWFINEKVIRQFLVVPEPNGVVAQEGLGSAGDVGMISAEFYYATQNPREPAAYDMLMANATRGASTALATALGPRENVDTELVKNVTFGKNPLALITIRYDRPELPGGTLPR